MPNGTINGISTLDSHKKQKSTNHLISALDRIDNNCVLFYSKLSIKISNILIAASLIFVPGPNTATAPASNKNW